jgi:hypothetical protein
MVVLLLTANEQGAYVLKAPNVGGVDVGIRNYVASRFEVEGLVLNDGYSVFGGSVPTAELRQRDNGTPPGGLSAFEEEQWRYRSYVNSVASYPADVDISPAGTLANYTVTYKPNRLYITLIKYNPVDTVVYGAPFHLDATYTFAQYNDSLRYWSSDTSVIKVARVDGRWVADARGVGRTRIEVHFAGDAHSEPQLPADTMGVEIDVKPYRDFGLKILNDSVIFGRRLPAPRFELFGTLPRGDVIDDLRVQYVRQDGAGNIAHIGSPPGNYTVFVSGIGNRNYAGGYYESGNLKIIESGSRAQDIAFDTTRISVLYNAAGPVVWAAAWPTEGDVDRQYRNRHVQFEIEDTTVAAVRDTFFCLRGDINLAEYGLANIPLTVDTLWGAVLRLNKAGVTDIYAFQAGDDDYRAVVSDARRLSVTRAPQSLDFAPVAMPFIVGDQRTLVAYAESGLSVTFTSSDTSIARVRGNTLTAVSAGAVTITAIQAGDLNWDSAAVSQSVTVLVPDLAELISLQIVGLDTGKFHLEPRFSPAVKDYFLQLPCDITRFVLHHDFRDAVAVYANNDGDVEFEGDSVHTDVTIAASPQYTSLEIQVVSKQNSNLRNTYTINLGVPLSKDLLYWDSVNFPNKIEVINNPDVFVGLGLVQGKFERYRWYVDSSLSVADTGGIYYRREGVRGHTYSVDVSYASAGSEWVKICESSIPLAAAPPQLGIEVFPNPSASYIEVHYSTAAAEANVSIQIYQLSTGALASDYSIGSVPAGNHSVTLNVSNLPAGAYLVKKGEAAKVMVKE